MEQRKDIGEHIGQELQSLPHIPSERLWSSIENTLDAQDKRRRRLILWWWILGLLVAFLLLFIGFSIGKPFTVVPGTEVSTEKQIPKNSETTPTIITENGNINEVNKNKDINTNQEFSKTYHDTIRNTQNKQRIKSTKVSSSETNTLFAKTQVIVTTTSEKIPSGDPNAVKNVPTKDDREKEVVADLSETSEKKKTAITTITEIDTINRKKNVVNATKSKELSEREQLRLLSKKRIDSIKKIRAEKRMTFASEEDIPTDSTEEKSSKWSVTVIAGPTYFNTFNNNATLDQELINATNSGHIDVAYGVAINFNLTKKLYLSFGMIRNNLAYNVDNILSATSEQKGAILSYSGVNLSSNANTESLTTFVDDDTAVSLLQKINYTEIPLELSYKFNQGKFGFQARGGFSVYITGNNAVFVENTNGNTFMLGEANNLSKANYSVNAGVGGFYEFSESILIEVMPTFKYQFNTLNNINYDSKTYILGVYTGVRYNF